MAGCSTAGIQGFSSIHSLPQRSALQRHFTYVEEMLEPYRENYFNTRHYGDFVNCIFPVLPFPSSLENGYEKSI